MLPRSPAQDGNVKHICKVELLVTSREVSRLEWTYCGSDEKFGGAGGNGNFVGWHASVALPITSADVWAGLRARRKWPHLWRAAAVRRGLIGGGLPIPGCYPAPAHDGPRRHDACSSGPGAATTQAQSGSSQGPPFPLLPPSGGLVDKLHMANADGGEVTGGGNGGGHKHLDLGKGLV